MNKNKIQYILAAGLAIGLLFGCKETRTEVSNVLHEDAMVVDLIYTPSRHGSGSAVGPVLSSDGNVGIGVSVVSVDIPEIYGAVFKCQHGKFVSQGSDKRHKDLWERLQEGQKVDVTYREIYKTTYDDVDKDGIKDVIKKMLVEYDFLDAQPKE